jgi:serine/threonine-protein kinase
VVSSDPLGLVGEVIDLQFRVDRFIGEGGFSAVYRGHHLGLDEPVAIKCLKLDRSLDSETIDTFVRRFRDEGRIAYRLSQGNLDIVRSITTGTVVAPSTGALVPYMVLELLDGWSLGHDFRHRRAQGLKGRTLDEVLDVFEPAVRAVAYAHSQGVVHRDLKPGNLFFARPPGSRAGGDGTMRLKVLDFGLAKIVDETIGIAPSVKTRGHFMICSPSYGAPEQFDPKAGPVGPWTDVYSLGMLVLEALRDKRVRVGEGLAQCAVEALDPNNQITAHALGIKVRPQVEIVLARAVALDTRTRQKSAAELWDALKGARKRRAGATDDAPLTPPSHAEAAAPVDNAPTVVDMRDSPIHRLPSGGMLVGGGRTVALGAHGRIAAAFPRIRPAAGQPVVREVEAPASAPASTKPPGHSPTFPEGLPAAKSAPEPLPNISSAMLAMPVSPVAATWTPVTGTPVHTAPHPTAPAPSATGPMPQPQAMPLPQMHPPPMHAQKPPMPQPQAYTLPQHGRTPSQTPPPMYGMPRQYAPADPPPQGYASQWPQGPGQAQGWAPQTQTQPPPSGTRAAVIVAVAVLALLVVVVFAAAGWRLYEAHHAVRPRSSPASAH